MIWGWGGGQLSGVKPDGSCIMYAPANTEYSDDVGAYKFIVDCPME